MTSIFFVSNVCKHFGNVRQLPFDSPLSFPLGHLFLWLQHYFSGCQLYLLFSLWFMTFSLHLCLCGACMHYVYKHIHNFPYTLWFYLLYFTFLIHLEFILISTFFMQSLRILSSTYKHMLSMWFGINIMMKHKTGA